MSHLLGTSLGHQGRAPGHRHHRVSNSELWTSCLHAKIPFALTAAASPKGNFHQESSASHGKRVEWFYLRKLWLWLLSCEQERAMGLDFCAT